MTKFDPLVTEVLSDRVHQATGAVVYSARVAPMDALKLLVMHAYTAGVTIEEAAELVMQRKMVISGAPPIAATSEGGSTPRGNR